MADQDFLNDLMEFNPSDLSAFQEPEAKSKGNPNIYKTNPNQVSKDISEDGHYHSKIRIIYNPFDRKNSIINSASYSFTDADGWFMVSSKLGLGDKSCKMFKAWKSLHFSTDDSIVIEYKGQKMTRKQWGDTMFDKGEARFCLVQVIEDANQPELVGKFLAMRLPKAIFDMLNAKMNPTDKSKAPQDLMNYLFGPILEMDVTPGPDDPQHPERKQREIKYTLCEFESDPTPIIMVTGEPLFSEDEMESIMDYAEGKKVLSNPKSTAKKKDEAKKKCEALVPTIKDLMKKALDYVSENAIDLVAEVGYKEPTPEQWARVDRWLDIVCNKFQDPATYVEGTILRPNLPDTTPEVAQPEKTEELENNEDDLPF